MWLFELDRVVLAGFFNLLYRIGGPLDLWLMLPIQVTTGYSEAELTKLCRW
jgi:hypothetical protein